MEEFPIGEHTYRIDSKLPAMTQDKILRRSAPAISALMGAGASPKSVTGGVAANLEMVGKGLGALSDDDATFIITTCLASTSRKDGERWAKVATATGQIMFADIDLLGIYQIVGRVLMENFQGFFLGLASSFSAPDQI